MENLETVSLGNAILKCFKGFILEFNNLTALEADQVIVVALSLSGFILCLSIRKFSLSGEAQTGEKLEGSIDRRIANFGIDLGHLGIDLTQILMPRGVEEDVENLFPLFGRLQAFSRNPRLKKILLNGKSFLKLKFIFILMDLSPFVKGKKKC
jgi:hypothetical protein